MIAFVNDDFVVIMSTKLLLIMFILCSIIYILHIVSVYDS